MSSVPALPAQDALPASTAAESSPPFFAVSLAKLSVLSFCTFGMYTLYWFYKNWKLIKEREQSSLSPFWRTVFILFFCISCFERIEDHGRDLGIERNPPGAILGFAWAVTAFSGNLPGWYGAPSFFNFIFMLPIQRHANVINELVAPGHDPNARYSGWNWCAIALGALLWLALIAGLLMGESL